MAAAQVHRQFMGVVVSAGRMMKTVKVRIADREWNKKIKKYYPSSYNVLCSDPRDSLREGDVITLQSGWRKSKSVYHVVTSIVAPFGAPKSERPAIFTTEELLAQRETKRAAKDQKRLVSNSPRGREHAKLRIAEREAKTQDLQVVLEGEGVAQKTVATEQKES